MITFSKIKDRLGDAINDLGEALTDALAWIEEGDNHELASGYKRGSSLRAAQAAIHAAVQKPQSPQLAGSAARWML
jgi:hypothetical protein